MPFSNNRLRLCLIRHGESENNVRESSGSLLTYWQERDPDPNLTKRGHEQAQLLATFLAHNVKSQFLGMHPLTEIWCSPVKRAMQTIQPLSKIKVVQTNGPYYGKSKGGETIFGGHEKYKGANEKMSCFANKAASDEFAVLNPKVKTEAYEQGGLYVAEFDETPDGGVKVTKTIPIPGLTTSDMERDFPGYDYSQTDGRPVSDKGWYFEEKGKETHNEARKRGVDFAMMLKARAMRNYNETKSSGENAVLKSENILLVAHFEFIAHLLNALLHFHTADEIKQMREKVEPEKLEKINDSLGFWRHFNTAMTVVDINGDTGHVEILRSNVIDHLAENPEMVSGFPLGFHEFK